MRGRKASSDEKKKNWRKRASLDLTLECKNFFFDYCNANGISFSELVRKAFYEKDEADLSSLDK